MENYAFFFIFFVTFISHVTTSSFNDGCPSILQSVGATPEYGNRVGHAIHSLSVRNLKKFKSDVTENNRIPTVNLNLTSDIPILFYAPDRTTPDSEKFKTDFGKTVDEVLSNMDNKNYYSKNYNLVEHIVYAHRMEEIWASALTDYKTFEETPPSKEVCQCATDIENNGILYKLRQVALIMREPELFNGYGQKKEYQRCLKANEKSPGCALTLSIEKSLALFNTSAEWKNWKKESGAFEGKDTALFLYCALNDKINIY